MSNMKTSLKKVINASGRMTKLGVSLQSDGVIEEMIYASKNYFEMDKLYIEAGKEIASEIGVNFCFVCNSASCAIALSIASLICQDNEFYIQNIHNPDIEILKREIIIPKGHVINYNVPISTMINLGGGILKEAGCSNKVTKNDIENCINEKTVALMYVKSHHCVQKNMVSLEEMISFGKKYHIPVLVDAAAEEDLKKYYDLGADFVIYSGSKALCAPASGIIICRNEKHVCNLRLQYYGIGRAMKIGKENIFGIVQAVKEYKNKKNYSMKDLEEFNDKLNSIKGISSTIVEDGARKNIKRCRVYFDKKKFGLNAEETNKLLHEGDVAVYGREHELNLGYISFDLRPIKEKNELEEIILKLKEFGEKYGN